MLAPSVPPSDLPRVTGAYDKICTRWVDFPPCIVGKASSLESHERLGLISLVLSKDYDAPLHTLSNTVLIDALCRSRAVFSVIACFMLSVWFLSAEYRAYELIVVQAVDSDIVPYQFANLHAVRYCLLANDTETLG